MTQAVGGWTGRADRVADILAVGPHLHQAGGEERLGTHRRAVPFDTCVFSERAARALEVVAMEAPLDELLGGGELPEAAECGLVDGQLVLEVLEEFGARDREGTRVVDRQRCRGVEVGEVADLVADGPSGRWGGERPLLRCERGDDMIECLLLGDEIVDDIGDLHRAATVSATPSAHATEQWWSADPAGVLGESFGARDMTRGRTTARPGRRPGVVGCRCLGESSRWWVVAVVVNRLGGGLSVSW